MFPGPLIKERRQSTTECSESCAHNAQLLQRDLLCAKKSLLVISLQPSARTYDTRMERSISSYCKQPILTLTSASDLNCGSSNKQTFSNQSSILVDQCSQCSFIYLSIAEGDQFCCCDLSTLLKGLSSSFQKELEKGNSHSGAGRCCLLTSGKKQTEWPKTWHDNRSLTYLFDSRMCRI